MDSIDAIWRIEHPNSHEYSQIGTFVLFRRPSTDEGEFLLNLEIGMLPGCSGIAFVSNNHSISSRDSQTTMQTGRRHSTRRIGVSFILSIYSSYQGRLVLVEADDPVYL
jgi:hypothetical protein